MNAMKATPKKKRRKGEANAGTPAPESQETTGELATAEAYIPDLIDAAGMAEDAAPEETRPAEEPVAAEAEGAVADASAEASLAAAEAEPVAEAVADVVEADASAEPSLAAAEVEPVAEAVADTAEASAAVEEAVVVAEADWADVEAALPDEDASAPVADSAPEAEAAAEPVAAGLPCPVDATPEALEDEAVVERVEHLAKDVAWVLIAAGVIGIAMPGVLGTPFLIAGAAALWPGNRKRLEKWRQGHAPKMFHGGMKQINRFLDDLERRYPRDGSKRRDG